MTIIASLPELLKKKSSNDELGALLDKPSCTESMAKLQRMLKTSLTTYICRTRSVKTRPAEIGFLIAT